MSLFGAQQRHVTLSDGEESLLPGSFDFDLYGD